MKLITLTLLVILHTAWASPLDANFKNEIKKYEKLEGNDPSEVAKVFQACYRLNEEFKKDHSYKDVATDDLQGDAEFMKIMVAIAKYHKGLLDHLQSVDDAMDYNDKVIKEFKAEGFNPSNAENLCVFTKFREQAELLGDPELMKYLDKIYNLPGLKEAEELAKTVTEGTDLDH